MSDRCPRCGDWVMAKDQRDHSCRTAEGKSVFTSQPLGPGYVSPDDYDEWIKRYMRGEANGETRG